MAEFKRTKSEVEKALKRVIGKKLGEVDTKHVFKKTEIHPKITGIAGDVIEQSVLGYPANSDQEPDLMIDGIPTEVKTTGIRYSTKSLKKNKQTVKDFEAKEPMSITAVSPKQIVDETFDSSKFWKKLEHTLMVYYHYDALKTVKSWGYKEFLIKGYEFHQFSNTDKKRFENDWRLVQKFIQDAQIKNPEQPSKLYPQLESALRENLLMIDTAPKWPKAPRFRLKRSTVTAIVQAYFGRKYEDLSQNINSYHEIDSMLHKQGKMYKGQTIRELISKFNIQCKLNKKHDVAKSIGERIFLKMIGANSKRLNNIDLFVEAGITLKTVVQIKNKGKKEDTKLFLIDFDDLQKASEFTESQFYTYFSESQFIFIVFETKVKGDMLLDNRFIGFKRMSFSDEFIEDKVKKAWENTRNLVLYNKVKESVMYRKDTGQPIINKRYGTLKKKLNFIKSTQNDVFVRGGGSNSKNGRTFELNDINMLPQYIWIKGNVISKRLSKIEFI